MGLEELKYRLRPSDDTRNNTSQQHMCNILLITSLPSSNFSFYKNKIKDSLESILCKEAKDALNNNGVRELATLNLQASINDILIINYRLAASPIFQNDIMETNHVGRFLNDYETENVSWE